MSLLSKVLAKSSRKNDGSNLLIKASKSKRYLFHLYFFMFLLLGITFSLFFLYEKNSKYHEKSSVMSFNNFKQKKHIRHMNPVNLNSTAVIGNKYINTSVGKDKLSIYNSALECCKKKNYQKASALVDNFLKRDPQNLAGILLSAHILESQQKNLSAEKILENNLPPIEYNEDYYGYLAKLYLLHQQALKAVDLYQRLVELQPNQISWWLGIIVSSHMLHNLKLERYAAQKVLAFSNLSPSIKLYINQLINENAIE